MYVTYGMFFTTFSVDFLDSKTLKTIVFPRKNNDFQEIACFCFDSFLSKHIPKTWRIQCWINDVTVFWKITKKSSPGIHFGSQNDPDLASEISKLQKNAPRRGFRVKSIVWSISELAKMSKKIDQGHLTKVSHASDVSCATQKGIAPLVRGSLPHGSGSQPCGALGSSRSPFFQFFVPFFATQNLHQISNPPKISFLDNSGDILWYFC